VKQLNIAIVGLGVVGTSIGLALKSVAKDIQIVGHDPQADLAKRARKLGAVDRTHWNLLSACSEADLIVLDVGIVGAQTTLSALSGEMADHAVIVDLSSVMQAAHTTARACLRELDRYVTGHVVSPSLIEDALPDAELLAGAVFYLAPLPETAPSALDRASNLAEAIGAKPHFVEPAEHDGLVAATSQMPITAALAMVLANTQHAGSHDRARFSAAEYGQLAGLLSQAPDELAESLLANQESLLGWLSSLEQSLDGLCSLLAAKDSEGLVSSIKKAQEAVDLWRHGGQQTVSTPDQAALGLRSLLLGGLGRR